MTAPHNEASPIHRALLCSAGLLSPRGSTRQDLLTLTAISSQTFDHRLGNFSTLHGLIDRHRVRTDKRSGIVNDPNQLDDPQAIIRLMGKVITVSLETVKISEGLPELL